MRRKRCSGESLREREGSEEEEVQRLQRAYERELRRENLCGEKPQVLGVILGYSKLSLNIFIVHPCFLSPQPLLGFWKLLFATSHF